MSVRVVGLELTSRRREEGATKVAPFFRPISPGGLGWESLDRTDKQANTGLRPSFHCVCLLVSGEREARADNG